MTLPPLFILHPDDRAAIAEHVVDPGHVIVIPKIIERAAALARVVVSGEPDPDARDIALDDWRRFRDALQGVWAYRSPSPTIPSIDPIFEVYPFSEDGAILVEIETVVIALSYLSTAPGPEPLRPPVAAFVSNLLAQIRDGVETAPDVLLVAPCDGCAEVAAERFGASGGVIYLTPAGLDAARDVMTDVLALAEATPHVVRAARGFLDALDVDTVTAGPALFILQGGLRSSCSRCRESIAEPWGDAQPRALTPLGFTALAAAVYEMWTGEGGRSKRLRALLQGVLMTTSYLDSSGGAIE